MAAVPSDPERPGPAAALRRAARLAVAAQALLLLAALRHHFVWGDSPRLPFSLQPLLAAFEAACLVGFAWLGGLAWWRGTNLAAAASPGLRPLWRLSLPIVVVALLVPPFLSMDVVDYVMRGRILTVHGGNPYVQVANDFPADPFLGFGDAGWKAFPLPYGPLVAAVQGAVAWLAHQVPGLSPRVELGVAVVLFKGLFALCLLGAASVARGIAAVLAPERRDAAFVGVLWSPLLLSECLGQVHNDALLLLAMLVAVRLLLAGRIAVGVVAMAVGVLAKVVPAALGPLWLAFSLRRRRLPSFVVGSVAAALLTVAASLPFFVDPAARQFLERQSGVLGASCAWALSQGLGLCDVGAALWLGRLAVLAAVGFAVVRIWQKAEPAVLIRCSAGVLAIAACSLGVFGPWYHVWWAPLALLGGPGFLHRFAVAVTVLHPLGYLVWTGLRRLDDPHQWVMLLAGVLVPAAAAIAWRRRAAPPAG